MAKYLKYQVVPELQIIVEYLAGEINLNELINFQISEIKDKSYSKEFNNVTDLRDAVFIVSEGDIKKYVDFVKQTDEMISTRKVAFLTNTPKQAALTIMYSYYIESSPINNKVFSTLDAAMSWVGISIENHDIIENILHKFRNS
jgi:hypothetical protein